MKAKIGLIMFLVALVLTACSPTQRTDTGDFVVQKIDSNLYAIALQLEEDVGGYSQLRSRTTSTATGVGVVASTSVIWQDGKGLVRGELQAIDPAVAWAEVEETIIVKTTDRKIQALFPGDVVFLLCVADFEPVCAFSEGKGAGECRDIWEFDFCRLTGFETAQENGEK